jgi:hypothetical protein
MEKLRIREMVPRRLWRGMDLRIQLDSIVRLPPVEMRVFKASFSGTIAVERALVENGIGSSQSPKPFNAFGAQTLSSCSPHRAEVVVGKQVVLELRSKCLSFKLTLCLSAQHHNYLACPCTSSDNVPSRPVPLYSHKQVPDSNMFAQAATRGPLMSFPRKAGCKRSVASKRSWVGP